MRPPPHLTRRHTRRLPGPGDLAVAGLLLAVAASQPSHAAPPPPTRATTPTTRYVGPTAAPRVATPLRDHFDRPVTVACSTCHTVKPPDLTRRDGASLKVFHQGLTMRHGGLTCVSCHDPRDYDRLRLADGAPVPFERVMTLCRQCHGPQARNYAHGAHGGMTGAWDRTKGHRTRNACTVCHDPHAPAYPRVAPAAGPADRGTLSLRRSPGRDRGHENGAPHDGPTTPDRIIRGEGAQGGPRP